MKKIILTFCIFHSALGISNAQTISLDSTFGIGGKVFTHFEPYGAQASVNSIVFQSDGKIVVAGSRESHYGVDNIDILLSRYNSNGILDNTFGIGGKVDIDINSADDYGYSVTIQVDDKIVVAGKTGDDFALLRYNSNGSLDNTFGIGGIVITDLGGYDYGRSLAIQSDGKIVVAGENDRDFALARYNNNGILDSTFDNDGKVTTDFINNYEEGYSVVIQSDGKIIVTGASWNGISQHFALARYNNDGSLDNAFGTGGKVITAIGGLPGTRSTATSVLLQSDGKIIAAGYYWPPSTDLSDSYSRFAVARYNNNGSLDTTFDSDGIVITPFGTKDAFGLSAAIQSDGKIIVTGFGHLWGVGFMLARYNTNGSLDNSFGTGGLITAKMRNGSDRSYSVAVQSDGKILVAGESQNDINWFESDFVVVRYNNNSYTPPPSPATIAIAAGGSHSLFLCNNNTSMSCGDNYYGQLGDETGVNQSTPVNVGSLNGITAISGGGGHSLLLKNDGTVWALGMNYYGQLGDGTQVDKSIPVQVSSLTGITAISAGDSHSLFLKNDGTVWACGFNDFLQLGDGSSTDKSTPIQLSSLSGITAISAGYQHSLFLKNDGTVWACGNNTSGALGNGTNVDKSTPVQVTSITNITAVAAGTSFSLFLKNDGTVWACGNNGFGQLGQGTDHTSTPIQVSSLSDIIAISAQDNHSLFLKNDGSVWACGSNNYGQLGDGTTVDKSIPVHISSLSGITSIAAGGRFSLFLKNDGTAWACGNNTYGELGDGTTVHKSIPGQVIGLCMACAPPQSPTAANANLCANNTANLSAIGTGILGWYNQASGGTYLGGGANYTTPILNTTTTYYVQDSTCAASATRKAVLVTVNPFPNITASASATHICAGESVILTGGGATSYTWSGGVTNDVGFIPTTTTSYTVTGTDGNNCSNSATKTIHVNPVPTVIANASATMVCAGTSITLSGGGASSYTWSGGVTNGLGFIPIVTTTYTVTGTDGNNCSNTATKTITVNPLPTVIANASASNVCEGTIVILTGGGAASYTWSDGITNGLAFVSSTTTTYTVTGTDGNNCSNTATKTINVTPLLDLTTSISGLTISANQNGANYQWLNCNNGNSVIAGATSQSYPALINGNYAVIVKMNSCSDTSTCVNVSITGIEKIAENNIQLKVFPNPGNGSITIQSINEGIYTIKNESGQMIQTFKLNSSNNYTISIENLSNGIYFIVGLNGNQMINQKVVVAK